MNQLTRNIQSTEVAEMVGRRHDQVTRDIRNIIEQLGDHTFVESYFIESEYTNSQNKQQPCYLLTKKGCELYGTRMTGEKGTQFAIAYIERFNEMEEKQKVNFTMPQPTQAEIIAMIAQQGVEQERRLNVVEKRTAQLEAQQENITQIVSLNPNEWKDKVNVILNKIALARGGGEQYRLVRNESYELLERRGHCRLNIRLENRKKEALSNGIISKAKIEKFKKIDVIADDPKLVEIYLAIVKEMAITHKIKVEGLGA
ncbi:Rha family transcriptional regulator [Lysinibacillus sp. NPDC096212]|uniref:Rha family transcriptional regulator n=1 Tax=Lysinibacillus sp. NPDC096212 TaxID=3364135 RepID=UPI0038287D45